MQEKKTAARGEQPAPRLPHNLIVEDRSNLTATGVTRVVNYDEGGAVLETQQGVLLVGGSGLSVSELSIQTGEVKIFGRIESLQYSEPAQAAGGLLRRLLR